MSVSHALKGIKIADFSWAAAGPLTTKILGDCGATVVKIESGIRVDIARTSYPNAGGIPGVNRSAAFAEYNSSKYSITLNLNHPRGLEVARRLIGWSDVVIENFTPGNMDKWQLGYENLKAINPDIIMISMGIQGQTGPHAKAAGLGAMLSGLVGFTHLVGWPDRPPVGFPIPYTDYIAPWYAVVAIIGALLHRSRTERGCYIDLSQSEAALSFLSPAILDYTANGRVASCQGNRCPHAAPHSVYRCQDNDRWCAIALFSDEEWRTFGHVIGEPEWTKEPKFATLPGRKEAEDELDALVESWTINHSAEEVMTMMQQAGLAAGVVKNGKDLHQDPQLKHRHHFQMLQHVEMGATSYESPSFKLSETPCEISMPAPCFGEHTEFVCREILGIPDEEFIQLLGCGAFE